VELNASDDRSGRVIRERITAAQDMRDVLGALPHVALRWGACAGTGPACSRGFLPLWSDMRVGCGCVALYLCG
jgi:hypothetical protein